MIDYLTTLNRDLAIKGLTNYGIADKEGLKRGMIELGMMKGTHRYTTNEKLEVKSILNRIGLIF